MDQRTQFIADHLRDSMSITELCAFYGVSRKTGYKWIDRYVRPGPAGLEERSRRPRHSPRHTPDEIVAAILDARRRHPRWGGKKLLALLHRRHPRWDLPGRSRACDILSLYVLYSPPFGISRVEDVGTKSGRCDVSPSPLASTDRECVGPLG